MHVKGLSCGKKIRRLKEKESRTLSICSHCKKRTEQELSGSTINNEGIDRECGHDLSCWNDKNMTRIPTVALAAERYGVSNWAAAAI
jgi:hypothetical protein